MSKRYGILGLGLILLALEPAAACAHAFSDKTIRYTYGGIMQRCVEGGACVTIPFHSTTGTVYFSENKVFDYGLDKAGAGVALDQTHQIVAGGKTIALTYGVVGQKFITVYNISDDDGKLLSSVAITISGSGGHCSVDYQQRQPGYRFSPHVATRQCIVVEGKLAQ